MVSLLPEKEPMELKSLRTKYKLSQQETARLAGIPLRTYVRYEHDATYGDPLKREMICRLLLDHCEITETKGLLTIEAIRETVKNLFEEEYPGMIDFCYLYGSYAKGYAKENSDIDLCVSTSLSGLSFAGLSEKLRLALGKRIDLVRLNNLAGNVQLINEIMKEGVKIYG